MFALILMIEWHATLQTNEYRVCVCVSQAIRDAQRESFDLNGQAVSGEELLEELFRSIRLFYIGDEHQAGGAEGGTSVHTPTTMMPMVAPSHKHLIEGGRQTPDNATILAHAEGENAIDQDSWHDRERSISSSSIGEGSLYRPAALESLLAELNGHSTPPLPPAPRHDEENRHSHGSSVGVVGDSESGHRHHQGHGQVGVDFVELLLRFLLIAVSRTYSSGDAFFVLEDLYGGEGLCLCGPNNHTQKTLMKVRGLCV